MMTSNHEKRRPGGESWPSSIFVNLYHQQRHAADSVPIYGTFAGSVQALQRLAEVANVPL